MKDALICPSFWENHTHLTRTCRTRSVYMVGLKMPNTNIWNLETNPGMHFGIQTLRTDHYGKETARLDWGKSLEFERTQIETGKCTKFTR